MRTVITDELWAVLGPAAEQARVNRRGAKPALSDRQFLEAVLHLARAGGPWRDLPGDVGRWDAVYNRYRRRVQSGGLAALFAALTAVPATAGAGRVLIDATPVRPHQHAAAARRRRKGPARRRRRPARVSAAAAAG